MSLTAAETQARSRCDSPAPRVASNPVIKSSPACKEAPQTPTPPFSVAAFLATALLVGRATLFPDAQGPLSDETTWTALMTFLTIGAAVMRFDILDIAKEEAKKEEGQSSSVKQSQSGWSWLAITSFSVLLLGIALACSAQASAGLQGQHRSWSSTALPLRTPPDSIGSSMEVLKLSKELYMRSSKLKGDADHIENVHGRYLDASLIRGIDYSARLSKAARRCAEKEAAAILANMPMKQSQPPSPRRWNTAMQLCNEAAIFFLSAALAIGLATSRSDVLEMSQEEEQDAVTGTISFPSAEKCLKPSRSHSQWRIFACGVLLLAAAVSMVISIVQDI